MTTVSFSLTPACLSGRDQACEAITLGEHHRKKRIPDSTDDPLANFAVIESIVHFANVIRVFKNIDCIQKIDLVFSRIRRRLSWVLVKLPSQSLLQSTTGVQP